MANHIISIFDDVLTGNIEAAVLELDNGDLIAAGINSATIRKSTDGGTNWVTKHTYADGDYICRTIFQDSRGYLFVGVTKDNPTTPPPILRSIDSGETWTEVAYSESDAWWNWAEDSSGNLYVSEYSVEGGGVGAYEGLNVWKSVNGGANWTKFYSHPPSTGGTTDGVRHIHLFAVDSSDTMYISFGDTPLYTGNSVAKTYILNSNGTLGDELSSLGNGLVSFVEASDGSKYFTGDTRPNYVYRYNTTANLVTQGFPYAKIVSAGMDTLTEINGLVGKDGVLYFFPRTQGTQPGWVMCSPNDGVTWVRLSVATHTAEIRTATLNKTRTGSRIYLGFKNSQNYISIPDYTRVALKALALGVRSAV